MPARRKTSPKAPRKKPAKRGSVVRNRCGGTMSEAEFVIFIKNALRGARWAPKYRAITKAFVSHGVNPATGHKCKLHLCPECEGLFPQNGMASDHVVPVVGPEGFVDWNTFIERLFVEVDGYRAVCKGCHKIKSRAEDAERRARKSKVDFDQMGPVHTEEMGFLFDRTLPFDSPPAACLGVACPFPSLP